MKYSELYIDENGFLMCGPENKSTSIVDGLRFTHNNEIGSYWNYEIKPINDLGSLCGITLKNTKWGSLKT